MTATELAILAVAIKYFPDFQIAEEQFLVKVRKQQAVKTNRFNFHLHQLTNVLEKWVIWQEVEEDKLLQKKLLTQGYRARFQEQLFFKENEGLIHYIQTEEPQNPASFLALFHANAELFYHSQTPKYRAEVSSLKAMEQNLDLFYKGVKLRLFSQKLSRSSFLKEVLDENAHLEWLAFAEKHLNIPFFKLYYNFIQFKIFPSDDSLSTMVSDFKILNVALDRRERIICIGLIINSLNTIAMSGNRKYQEIHFDLMQYTFAEDLAIFDNEIRDTLFNNYFVDACMLKKFAVAKKFLTKYARYLRPSSRKELVSLLECTLLYEKEKIEMGYLKLNQLQFSNSIIRLRSKNLQAKCLFKLYEKDVSYKSTLQLNLSNFKRFIEKQKELQDSRKTAYLNLISILRKMAGACHKRKQEKKTIQNDLIEQIHKFVVPPISKPWLLKQLKQWD